MRILIRKENWTGARSASKGVFLALVVVSVAIAQTDKPATSPHNTEHQDLSFYLCDDGTGASIRTVADWQHRRRQIISGMQDVMGPLPHSKSPVPLDVKILEEHQGDGYIRRKIAYHTDDLKQTIRAWLLLPNEENADIRSTPLKRPAVLCLHQTNVRGKDSPAGLFERHNVHYAKELAQRGYVTLAPDYPSFGESTDYDFDADNYISGTMKAIYDNTRAIDLLQSLPEVDPNRIGCIGHSLGGHNTLFTAAFDTRIKAAVTSCGFTTFHKYKGGNLTGWTSPRYMPLIKTKYKLSPDQMPFDFAEVIAAIAPRAVFVVAPLHDDNFDVAGVREIVKAAVPVYRLLGAVNNFQAVHPDSAHDFPDAERMQAYEFLDRTLKSSKP